MENLTFPMLTLQLVKHQDVLGQQGISVELISAANLFEDTLIISRQRNGKSYRFGCQFRKWDRYREFFVTMGSSVMGINSGAEYYFRLNPVTGKPIRILRNNSNGLNGRPAFAGLNSSWLDQEFPSELQEFAEDILTLINQLIERIQIDKVGLDSTEITN